MSRAHHYEVSQRPGLDRGALVLESVKHEMSEFEKGTARLGSVRNDACSSCLNAL